MVELKLLFLLVLISWCYCDMKKFPIHYYSSHSDGHTLRDGKEIVVHLKQRETKRFIYQVKEVGTPLHVVVTPCGGAIRWKVTQQLDEWIGDDSEESSGDFLGGGDFAEIEEIEDENSMVTRPSQKYQLVDKSSTKTTKRKMTTISSTNDANQQEQQQSSNKPSLLKKEGVLVKEVGVTQMEYFSDKMPLGILHFYITSEGNSTGARVFITSGGRMNGFFPKLPKNNRVQIINITTNSVSLEWDQSPSGNLFKKGDVDYCLVLSDTHEFHSYCELNPDINLDLQAQHDIEKLKSKTNRFTPSESAYSPNFGVFKRVSSEGKTVSKPRVNCLKYKSSYIYENLRQESKYFLSLFAINTKTGGSVAYEGASFFTRKRELEVFTLQDGKMVASYLNPARAAFKLYQFRVKHFHRNVLLNIQPCSGTLRVQIFKDDQLIKRSLFEELKSFVFESVTPGVLKIKVSNDDNDAKIYRIWASVKTSKNPYPKMPVDTSIKVLEHSRTCHSVTLAWLLTNEKHDYCLHKRMEEDDYFKKLILEESDQCRGPKSDMQLVFCRRVKPETEDDLIHNETVTDLKPSTTYRFDLFASKPQRQAISYRTVWVKTRGDCGSDSSDN